MPPKRLPQSPSSSNLAEPQTSSASSTGLFHFPRATSPSGIAHLISKPSKWFRGPSSSKNLIGSSEPRSSTSSMSTRKHKISQPTDPRPILSTLHSDPYVGNGSGSRSVHNLSLSRVTNTLDPIPSAPSTPISSTRSLTPSRGMGDLRNISGRAWSKSADDLIKLSTHDSHDQQSISPLDTDLHHKITIYRNRSESVTTPTSPSTIVHNPNKTVEFPTITGLSSSPPHGGGVIAPSGSAPTTLAPSQDTNYPVHVRSQSFTPRIASRLVPPKLGVIPVTPTRKGSTSSDVDLATPGSASRGGFSFNVGVNKSSSPSVTTPTTPQHKIPPLTQTQVALDTPTIVEPTPQRDDETNEKRTSQIVYHSGFLNRLGQFSPALLHQHAHQHGGALSKGWKPFKLVLKGSKLYFYKPPHDRMHAVKELFPTELVTTLEEAGADLGEISQDEDDSVARGKEKEDSRRKRAFWGRRTHPNLVRGENGDGDIEKGTLEALVHESAFGTTFAAGENAEARVTVRNAKWRNFSLAVLMCLPRLAGKANFETEFLRCCSFLISGAEESSKDDERAKVRFLTDEYLRYHSRPADENAWEQWRKETIPDFPTLTEFSAGSSSGVPQSSSTQALYTPSPAISTGMSPNLGAFSPRPKKTSDSTMASLLEALEIPSPSIQLDLTSPSKSAAQHALWNALECDGLTRDVFLRLDPHLIASSLNVFHRSAWGRTPENVSLDAVIDPESTDSAADAFLPFFSSESHPHWLTKTILLQIFGQDGLSSSRHGTSAVGEDREPSRGHSRSEVISAWVKIGDLSRQLGDECSWKAISSALFSRPVARVEKVWKRVDPLALSVAVSWIHPRPDGGVPVTITEQKQTPWGGDIGEKVKEKIYEGKIDDSAMWNIKPFFEAREMWESMRTSFMLCPRATDFNEAKDSESMTKMLDLWSTLCAVGGSNGSDISSKFTQIDHFMSLSFAAESRRRGLYEPYFWSSTVAHNTHTLLPLQFPEPMPCISLVEKPEIVRGRMESSNLNSQDIQAARNMLLNPEWRSKQSNLDSPRKEALAVTGDIGGIDIPVFDGELVVTVQFGGDSPPSHPPSCASSRPSSRPPSTVAEVPSIEKTFTRSPSIRLRAGPGKPTSKSGLERKSSMARRNSLPSISNNDGEEIPTEISSERILRVRVKAGTLDRLVDILAHGLQGVSVAFADDNGEMPLREGKHRDLKVDQEDFSLVWWKTFRSFLTPPVFFELLLKRYHQAQVKSPTASAGRLLHSARVRSEILEVMQDWLQKGSGAEDVLDDLRLYDMFKAFLLPSSEHDAPELYPDFQDPAVREAWSTVEQTRRKLTDVFSAQMLRPASKANPVLDLSNLVTGNEKQNFGIVPPDLDVMKAVDFVNNLDAMVASAFLNVTDEDLLATADLLEIQSADRTGWFLSRDASSVTEEVELQTLHTLIAEVETTSLISDLNQDSFYRLLPGSIRACIRAFGILRKWVVSKIVAPKLGPQVRHIRIEILLQAIEISRTRNMDPSSSGSIVEQPCIRSFVEAVVASALLGAESRMHYRAWQSVANARRTSLDSLALLLNPPSTQCAKGEPLMVDIGWLLERMIEVISMPDVLDSSAEELLPLVNFDKRRFLCRLATNVLSLTPARKGYRRNAVDSQDLKRLSAVEREVSQIQWDLRAIREEAHREAFPSGAPAKKIPRPFSLLVLAQQEKNKRDKYVRDRLSKEKRQEQYRHEKREEHINKALNPRKPQTVAQKQHRNKKSMSSAFFQFMRPISSAFSSDTSLYASAKRTPAELDFTTSGKPALVLSVAEARVAQFINNERSFTFQLDTEDGGHYLLQALSKKDMMKWINKISHVGKVAAKRRLTYLGNSAKPQLDDLTARPKTGSHDPHAVFGVDLQFLISREFGSDLPSGAIPPVIEQCISEIEERGLSEVGIYRIAGATSEINFLKEAFNRGECRIQNSTDIYALCDVVKSYFRTLPDPVIPARVYFDFIATARIAELEPRLEKLRWLVHRLPQANFDLLKRFIEHLDKVTDYEESNQMTASSLSIVVSPNILRAPNNDFSITMGNMGQAHAVAKALITHCHVIFEDADPEADNDDIEEEEYERAILEEEEEEEEEEELPAIVASSERPSTIFGSLNELSP